MINVAGPDGSNVAFPDGTPEGEITAALDSHFGNSSRETSRVSKAASPSLPEGVVRAAGTGVPVAGGLLNKLDAATNAALAPLLDKYMPENFDRLPEGSFNERYQHALDIQNAKDKQFGEEHPVLDTTAQIVGGIGSTGAFLKTAPKLASRVLGLTGRTLPAQVAQGAAAGAGIGAADSATRGQDAGTGAMIGGMTGAVTPVAANLAGKALAGIRGLRTPTEPQTFTEVAGKKVPLTVGQDTRDIGAQMDEQAALRGGDSPKTNAVAKDYFGNVQRPAVADVEAEIARRMSPAGELTATTPQEGAEGILNAVGQRGEQEAAQAAAQAQALGTARSGLSQTLSPSSAPSNPLDAASVVQSQIMSMRQAEQAAGQQATQRVAQQGESLMQSMHPQGQVLANSPAEAGEVVQNAVSQARGNAQGAYREAYDALGNAEGKFHPASFNGIGERITKAVTAPGSEIPEITKETTPIAARALSALEDVTTGLTQQRVNGRIQPVQPITGAVVDNARKRLNSFLRVAKQQGQASGNWADYSATKSIVDQFDTEIHGAISSGKYLGGDGQALLDSMSKARGLYANYRKTFTGQGRGDRVGPLMESIVGRFEGQEAPVEQVGKMLTSGNNAPLLGKRLVQIFGADSPEVGAAKQGVLSSLLKDATGNPLAPEKAAANLEAFAKNSSLADVYGFDRDALTQHARALRQTVPVPRPATDVVTPAMQRIAGEGGGQPHTPQQVADMILGAKGVGQNPVGVQLAAHLKRMAGESSPAFQAMRSSAFERLHGADSGETAANINDLLTGRGKPMADVLYSPEEQAKLGQYGQAHADAATRATGPTTSGSKLMQDLKGLTGRQPTPSDLTAILNPRNGRERAVELARSIKGEMGENSSAHVAMKQGLWSQVLENKTGPLDMGSKATISKLEELLHGSGKPLAQEVYSSDERQLLQSYLDLQRKITYDDAAINRSNTATVTARLARGLIDTVLGGVGAFHFGPLGMAAGVAADRGQTTVKDVIRSVKLAHLLYGTPQSLHAAADMQRTLGRLMAIGQRGSLSVMH